ncbi:transposase domain-containing protein [Streptomyces sp. NRRL F-2664]|uniref:transposase domain-containing protein n=1 Tax=Streptomyces sp. NRRL F-2664 TaxID=1463842 RepID=UPI003B633C9C
MSDRIALGVLTRVFPPELVDEVVAECGRVEQRSRLLPARVVVYFVLAMCLFPGQGYEEVARLLTQGLERVRRWEKPWRVPTTAAIGRARRRLGPDPLRVLFDRVCRPVATAETAGASTSRTPTPTASFSVGPAQGEGSSAVRIRAVHRNQPPPPIPG